MSLRVRMLFAALLPVILVTLLLSGTFVYWHVQDIKSATESRGLALARQAATGAEFGLFSGNARQLHALAMGLLVLDNDIEGIAVLDLQGHLIAEAGTLRSINWPARGDAPSVRSLADGFVFVVPVIQSTLNEGDDVYSGADFAVAVQPRHVLGHVVIELSRVSLDNANATLLLFAFLFSIAGALVGGFVAVRIARSVTVPLLAATEVVSRVGRGDIIARIPESQSGPLKVLAQGINVMANRVAMTQAELQRRVVEATIELTRQRDAAQQATSAKSRFLAAASHDLRQPLLALGLFSSRLQSKVSTEERTILIANIYNTTISLQTMLDTLLDLSRLESLGYRVDSKIFDLATLIEKHCAEIRPMAEEKGLDIRIRTLPVSVRSDPLLAGRMLSNLLHNAVKYTHAGKVLVACRRVSTGVRVQVWDTGIGIPDDLQADIFSEYVQVGNHERDVKKGLGLGLSICQRISHLLDAGVGFRSVYKRGTVFWFDLPLVTEVTDATEVTVAIAAPRVAGTVTTNEVLIESPDITVADSMPHTASVITVGKEIADTAAIADAIASWGFGACVAADSRTAVSMCAAESSGCRVVVCDVSSMGEAEALLLCGKLREVSPQLGIVLINTEAGPALHELASTTGYFVLKQPVVLARLKATLQSLLEVTASA